MSGGAGAMGAANAAAKLYHERIMALARDDSARGRLDGGGGAGGGGIWRGMATNPLCGDDCAVFVRWGERRGEEAPARIAELRHETRGCALCLAAAAGMAQGAEGKTIADMRELRAALLRMLKENGAPPPPPLDCFAPAAARKSRHSCVLLPFDALMNAAAADADTAGMGGAGMGGR